MPKKTKPTDKNRAAILALNGRFMTKRELADAIGVSLRAAQDIISKLVKVGGKKQPDKVLAQRAVVGGEEIYHLPDEKVDIATIALMEPDYKKRVVAKSELAIYNKPVVLLSSLPDIYGRYPFRVQGDNSGRVFNLFLTDTVAQSL